MSDNPTLVISVNGEERRLPGPISLIDMLGGLGLDPRKVAVERNLEIVPRSTLDEVRVENGDAYEIVHFVGGG
jgi:thiazole synthase